MSDWLAWAVLIALAAPIIFIVLRFWYGFAVMSNGWAEALLVGLGFGVLIVFSTALEDGIKSPAASGMLVGSVTVTLILKAIHVYIEPRFRR